MKKAIRGMAALLITLSIVGCQGDEGKVEGTKVQEVEKVENKEKGKEEVEDIKEDESVTRDREAIKEEYKWRLEDIYPSWDEWNKDLLKIKEIMKEIPEYKGKMKESKENLRTVLQKEEELSKLVDKVYLYPYMKRDLNSKDTESNTRLQEIQAMFTEYSAATAWMTPELLSIPKETVEKWISEDEFLKEYEFSLMETFRLQKHVLNENEEKILSYYGQFLGTPTSIYKELTTSDIKWNEITLSDGKKVKVTNGEYSKILSTSRNQEDRKRAFEALYSSYNDNKNTYSAIYRGILQKNLASTKARNYDSVLERALEGNDIPVDVYKSLIEVTKKNTAPLKRYIELRKKALKLEEYHYYDNQVNIVNYDKSFEYEDAKEMVLKSVDPLGSDYEKMMEEAVGHGWLDVYETENKRSGAYSIGVYGVHPYMLLNYTGTLNSVFTLAHELGHTMHSMLSMENQPYSTNNYTIFVAEVASTFNERLLLDYMLEHITDSTERIALIEQALGNIVGTYYIQTLFADYEYQANQIVENGGAITADVLDKIMGDLFKEYFGEGIVVDDLQKVIWSRIPHFFNSPFYVYQYATCFASSAVLHDKITNEKYDEKEREEALNKYLTLLKSGGNDHPMEQLKKAGVDLSEEDTIAAVSKDFDRLLDLLEKELEKVEK